MRLARLNVFQKTQRRWDAIHPYNAAQFATLGTHFSLEQLTTSFNRAIVDLRLGTFVCVDDRYWIDPSDWRPVVVAETNNLTTHLDMEMNRPFDGLAGFPLRPFVSLLDGRMVIGIVYQHWVADSVSIRTVMRAWLSQLLHRADLMPARIVLDEMGLAMRFSPTGSQWSVIAQACGLLSFARSMKQMRRVESLVTNQHVATLVRSENTDLIERVRLRARSCGATVGDVLLAGATLACGARGPNHFTRRRPGLAMGTIVDLRSRARHLSERVFGLFLGFTISPFALKHLTDINAAIERARQLRVSQNHQHTAEASQVQMSIGLALARRLSPKSLLDFYRKRLPLSGGISNVNLTGSWLAGLSPDVVNGYYRISPTGPMMPIVFTPTTLNGQFSLCCTYKTALLDHAQANSIVDAFFENLRHSVASVA